MHGSPDKLQCSSQLIFYCAPGYTERQRNFLIAEFIRSAEDVNFPAPLWQPV